LDPGVFFTSGRAGPRGLWFRLVPTPNQAPADPYPGHLSILFRFPTRKAFLTIPKPLSVLFVLFLIAALPSSAQLAQPGFRSPVKEVKVTDIRLEGNKTVDKSLVIHTIQVEKGAEYLPPMLRHKVQSSI